MNKRVKAPGSQQLLRKKRLQRKTSEKKEHLLFKTSSVSGREKLANFLAQALDPHTLNWIAGVVFGIAIVAEAQARSSEGDDSAMGEPMATDDAGVRLIPNSEAILGAEFSEADGYKKNSIGLADTLPHDGWEFNLGPSIRTLLAEIATQPISDAPSSLENLKHFFKYWFAENKIPQHSARDLEAGASPQSTYQDAISIAVEKAAIEFSRGGLGSSLDLGIADPNELYPNLFSDSSKMLKGYPFTVLK